MVKNNSIVKSLFEINGKLDKVSSYINSAKNALVSGNMSLYENNISNAILSLEGVTLRARNVANYSFKINGFPNMSQRLNEAISLDAHKISVEKVPFGYRIVLPATLPHYDYQSKTVLSEPLNTALRSFNKAHPISKINSAVIVFVNHVNAVEAKFRDNDNYEYKQLVNCVTTWFLPDDNCHCCNMFNTTKPDSSSFSEIWVVPTEQFNDFYSQYVQEIM